MIKKSKKGNNKRYVINITNNHIYLDGKNVKSKTDLDIIQTVDYKYDEHIKLLKKLLAIFQENDVDKFIETTLSLMLKYDFFKILFLGDSINKIIDLPVIGTVFKWPIKKHIQRLMIDFKVDFVLMIEVFIEMFEDLNECSKKSSCNSLEIIFKHVKKEYRIKIANFLSRLLSSVVITVSSSDYISMLDMKYHETKDRFYYYEKDIIKFFVDIFNEFIAFFKGYVNCENNDQCNVLLILKTNLKDRIELVRKSIVKLIDVIVVIFKNTSIYKNMENTISKDLLENIFIDLKKKLYNLII